MTKAKAKLPPTRRVQDTFADLLTNVNTLVPQPEVPSTVGRSNAAKSEWLDKHKAVSEMWFTHVGKQWFEAQHLAMKKKVSHLLGIADNGLDPGHDEMFSLGNIGLRLKVDNGQNRLDRDALRTVLMTELKLSAERAEEIITSAQKKGKPPVHLTPTLINE